MPIKIKTDVEFGDVWYIKSDPDQLEHRIVGIVVVPGNQIKFVLDYMGDECTMFDFLCSQTRGEIIPTKDED